MWPAVQNCTEGPGDQQRVACPPPCSVGNSHAYGIIGIFWSNPQEGKSVFIQIIQLIKRSFRKKRLKIQFSKMDDSQEFAVLKEGLWLPHKPCCPRGGTPTSSAPVTEYACPFTSFCEVTASVSAALVICRSKGHQ